MFMLSVVVMLLCFIFSIFIVQDWLCVPVRLQQKLSRICKPNMIGILAVLKDCSEAVIELRGR